MTQNRSGNSRKRPQLCGPVPGWGSGAGQGPLPGNALTGWGAGMRGPLMGLGALPSLPAGSWLCPDWAPGPAVRGFQT